MGTWHCKTETVFDYTWKQVMQAFWNRYPNPSSTHVLTEDTVCREVRDGKLYSRRLLSKNNPVPKWGERFYKSSSVRIIEDSVLDPQEKTLITFTRNIGFQKIMKVDEIVEYKEQSDGRTVAVRRAYISSQVFGFKRAICALGIERFKSNCNKAALGFNYVLRNMFPSQTLIALPPTMKSSVTTQIKSEVLSTNNNSGSSSSGSAAAVTQLSKREYLKKVAKTSYVYMKTQAIKIAQLFSVKN